jgi:adenylosuccinate lyase
MPHKRNPILAERLCGLARIARATVDPLTDGVSQWHERDIAHSSVERVLLPQLAGVAHYALLKGSVLVDGLQIDKERLKREIAATNGLVYSHSLLAALQYTNRPRSRSHELVEEMCTRVPSESASLKKLVTEKFDKLGLKPGEIFAPHINLQHLWNALTQMHKDLVRPEREKQAHQTSWS